MKTAMKPIFIGVGAAFFFAFTFVLNRSMELSGGSWIWSASLRYIFMIPFLLVIVLARRNFGALLIEMKRNLLSWIIWSFVGFGLFYGPLCYAAAYSPGWLIAGTWQVTIISGALLAPLFYEFRSLDDGVVKIRGGISFRGLSMSLIILLGIAIMQMEQAKELSGVALLLGVIPVLVASFAYPLGNRKMMEVCEGRLDPYQRVLGMTLASLPLWLLLSLYGFIVEGPPTGQQSVQALLVAVSSGVIATVLFFRATDMVRGNMQKLAAVEATQSIEVLFALIGEVFVLSAPLPSLFSWLGMMFVIVGMVLHSYLSNKPVAVSATKGVAQ